jgi:diguanylate cyclase (GGDEF)-like protein
MEKYEKSKKERKGFGIIVFDVNNLKWVNDNLGHLAGDKLLQDSAAIIRDGFEGYGKTYRYGGDEFVVIMEDGAKEKYSYGIQQMERLLARHNENFKKKEWISIAYGVAYYDGSEEETLWQVHAAADSTMYERKRQMKAKMVDGKDVRRDMRVDPV